jgi:hypothetical protein
VVVVVVVDCAAILVVLVSSPITFPAVPGASPDVLAASELAYQSWCFPFAAAATSERQPQDLLQPVEGSVEDPSLFAVG